MIYIGMAIVALGKAYVAFLIGDVVTALGHFVIDRYLSRKTWLENVLPFLESVRLTNLLHHALPLTLLRHGPWANARETLPAGALILLVAYLFGVLTWPVGVIAATIATSNIYHRLQHMPKDQVWKPVRWLQRIGVLQSRETHNKHHTEHVGSYAIYSAAVNWAFEAIDLFSWLELLIFRWFHIKPVDLKALSEATRLERRQNA